MSSSESLAAFERGRVAAEVETFLGSLRSLVRKRRLPLIE
jgi:hypothetical protein